MRTLAEGRGWRVSDIVCTSGPNQPPFEEAHEWVSISAVLSGSFVYRSTHGRRLMVPGSFLLGNQHSCFECSHEHGRGDRCIAVHYAPELVEDAARRLKGVRRLEFLEHRLPPRDRFLPYIHLAARLARHPSKERAEEAAFQLISAVLAETNDAMEIPVASNHEKRVAEAIHRINNCYDERLTLDELAEEAELSRFHFARIFSRIAGTAPYAYVLNRRLMAAAAQLSSTDHQVLSIALSCGFDDLSEFTRRFRKRFGRSPSAFRKMIRSDAGS